MEGDLGQEKIVDGVRVITCEPYGITEGDEFALYLPGKSLAELPEMFLGWVHINLENLDSEDEELTFYGLFNMEEELGFSSDFSN